MTVHTPTPERFRRRFEQRAMEITGVRLDPSWAERAAGAFPPVMREHAATSWAQLEALLDSPATGPALVERLVGEVTVQETRLFRDVGQMRLLVREVLPEARERAIARRAPMRVWSAGCASGEEAYSVAILAAEAVRAVAGARYVVLGTDISASAIARARRGTYPQPAELWNACEFDHLLDRYTETDARGMRVVGEEIRANTRFAAHNLLGEKLIRGQDVVLCRNVMVYLPRDARELLIRRLWDALNPGGWLLTGEADLIHQVPNSFETWHHDHATLYRRPLAGFWTRGEGGGDG